MPKHPTQTTMHHRACQPLLVQTLLPSRQPAYSSRRWAEQARVGERGFVLIRVSIAGARVGTGVFGYTLQTEGIQEACFHQTVPILHPIRTQVNGAALRYMDPGQRAELNAMRSALGSDYEARLRKEAGREEGFRMLAALV